MRTINADTVDFFFLKLCWLELRILIFLKQTSYLFANAISKILDRSYRNWPIIL